MIEKIMKKVLFFCLFTLCMSVIVGCSSCKSEKNNKENESDVNQPTELVVENVINTDKQYMFTTYGSNYRWYETGIVLSDWLDTENFDGSIESITNVFQVVSQASSTSYDVNVVFITHTNDSTVYTVKEGFYVENYPLNEEIIKLTYKNAFERVMEVNSPKPHTRNCILRKPIGSIDCNPQYIFGNTREQLWVDAVTGDVKNDNPAFPEGEGFKMPLGEWP